MPGLKEETRVVGDVEIRCKQFQAMEALALVPRVSVLSAHTLRLAAQRGVSGDDRLEALVPVVFDIAIGLAADEMQQFARDLLAGTQAKVDGEWVDLKGDKAINVVFAGNLPALFRAVLFAVEVNFLSFFAGALPAGSRSSAVEEKPAA